jgi:hypothetical protein
MAMVLQLPKMGPDRPHPMTTSTTLIEELLQAADTISYHAGSRFAISGLDYAALAASLRARAERVRELEHGEKCHIWRSAAGPLPTIAAPTTEGEP